MTQWTTKELCSGPPINLDFFFSCCQNDKILPYNYVQIVSVGHGSLTWNGMFSVNAGGVLSGCGSGYILHERTEAGLCEPGKTI